MAGEYQLAQRCLEQAFAAVDADPALYADTFEEALLRTLLKRMLETRSAKNLQSLIDFQLEAAGESEFVITRGS